MNRILITGAAGYLGQTTGLFLLDSGYSVTGIDDFSSSSKTLKSPFEIIEQDLRDFDASSKKIKQAGPFDGVIHFAAKALVPESFQKPFEYFDVNMKATLTIAESCRLLEIPILVHSSTCAIYGIPSSIPIQENSASLPISPYGESKKCAEHIIERYASLGAFKALVLRYFNPAGALKNSGFGECHHPETHLVPLLLRTASMGNPVQVFGKDYPTPDGTCIRDFIHVEDLSIAHLKALLYLQKSKDHSFQVLNVGTGKGTSILETIKAAEETLNLPIQIQWCERRTGDPAQLVADITNFKELFGWVPSKSINEILEDQWLYQKGTSLFPTQN